MGFDQQIRSVISKLPKQRRTGLFSATMTDALSELVKAGLRNPVRVVVKVEDLTTNQIQRIPATLSINYLISKSSEKLENLVRFLAQRKLKKGIVFFCTCHCVDYYHKVFLLSLLFYVHSY